jgi:DNA invertase Pin-like site-specific DNA recombinase
VDRPSQITSQHLQKLALVYIRQSSPEQVRDNSGSTDVQRRLADRPVRWGWAQSRVHIIDGDLGASGSHAGRRKGFRQMLDLMDRGEVAIVFVSDASRLSRNPSDAEDFLRIATYRGVLLEVNGTLFAPGDANLPQLFNLRLQNLLAWWDQANRTRDFKEAKYAKAARGFAITSPPDGFVISVRGSWVQHPDPQVRESIRRPFDLYLNLGSGKKVARYMNQHGFLLPRRTRGDIIWERVTTLRIIRILRNPLYTDAYLYNRSKWRHDSINDTTQYDVSACTVFRNHHEPYVSWEQWKRIQQTLDRNRRANRPPVLGGAALLQGLLWCGRCGRRLKSVYDRRVQGHSLPSYLCSKMQGDDLLRCIWVPAERLDNVVVPTVLTSLVAPSIEDLRAVIQAQHDEEESIQRNWHAQIRRAEAEVAERRRRYLAVDPRHDLVKIDLEGRLQETIAHFDQLKRQQAALLPVTTPKFRDSDWDDLVVLSNQLHSLWHASSTGNEDRKRLLHTVLSRVTIREVSPEWIDLDIDWVGGLKESRRVIRSKGIGVVVGELRQAGHTDIQIADALHARGVTARAGGRVSQNVISKRVQCLGLQHRVTWQAGLCRIRELVLEGHSTQQIRRELEVNGPRHYRGAWTLRLVQDAIRRLRQGRVVHGVPSLPADLGPLHETPQPALALMLRRRAEGCSWRAIAKELNASGQRPARADKFTERLCALVFSTRRLKGTLPGQGPARDRRIRRDTKVD